MPGMSDAKPTVVFWIVLVLSAIVATTLFVGALWLFDLVPINP
jgi:hypothetical protein